MNARTVAVFMVGGLVLAAFARVPLTEAQVGAGSSKSIFSQLKVGQMVEYTYDGVGAVIRTYDDADKKSLMTAKIKEIGGDFIALEVDDKEGLGTSFEIRAPVYRFSGVTHVAKSAAKPSTKKK